MIRTHRAWIGLSGIVLSLGACQLVSGLSGYQESGSTTTTGGGGATGTTTGATTGTGGSTSTTTGEGGCGSGVICGNESHCVDLMTDPKHCGACEKPCKDPLATCAGGLCEPAVLGGPYLSVSALSANDNGVCWLNTSPPAALQIACRTITSSNLDPTVELPLLGWVSAGGIAVGVDGQRVFITRNEPLLGGLYRWKLGVDAGMPLVLLHGDAALAATGGVVTASETLTRWAGVSIGNQWGVYTTGNSSPNTTGIHSAMLEPRFASDSEYVYWSSGVNLFQREPKEGGVPQDLKATFATLDYLASDGNPDAMGYLYWISNGVTLRRVLKDVNAPAPVTETSATSLTGAQGLAVSVDGGLIYWLEGGTCSGPDGKLMRLIWGEVPEELLGSLACPHTLGIGGAYLYYSAGAVGDTHVYRVPR